MYEFLVLGSGITGASAAIRLSSLGYRVAIVGMGESATSSSAGIITLQLELLEDIELVKESIGILGGLMDGVEPKEAGVTEKGFISIEDEDDAEESAGLLRRAGVKFRQVKGGEAKELWPGLKFWEDEIITYTEDDICVEPQTLLNFLHRKARELGAEVLKDEIKELIMGEKLAARLGKSGKVEAETIILCLGPWTRDFLAEYGILIPTWVIRCPAFRFKIREQVPAFADEVYESYWRPGADETVVGGSYHAESIQGPREFFDEPPKRFRREAERLLRLRLRGEVKLVESWTGPCSITPDLNPILDALPGHDDIYLVDGLRGYGLMRGPALGYMVADLASGRKPRLDPSAYSLTRFSRLNLKHGPEPR